MRHSPGKFQYQVRNFKGYCNTQLCYFLGSAWTHGGSARAGMLSAQLYVKLRRKSRVPGPSHARGGEMGQKILPPVRKPGLHPTLQVCKPMVEGNIWNQMGLNKRSGDLNKSITDQSMGKNTVSRRKGQLLEMPAERLRLSQLTRQKVTADMVLWRAAGQQMLCSPTGQVCFTISCQEA